MVDPSSRDQPSTGPLPAPYANPWSTLLENLRAVVADLRLRLQELWRRNAEGTLSTPGFWPRDLAPLFWPLCLLLLLLLIGGIVLQFRRDPSPEPSQEVMHLTTSPLSADGRTGPAISEPASDASALGDLVVPSFPGASSEPSPEPFVDQAEQQAVEQASPLQTSAPPIDPLLRFLSDDDEWITAATPQPSINGVLLVVSEGWALLPEARRQQCVDHWWERLEAEGFSELRIEAADQRLLARTARVGSGMILFESSGR